MKVQIKVSEVFSAVESLLFAVVRRHAFRNALHFLDNLIRFG
jgi:hypothetical protein